MADAYALSSVELAVLLAGLGVQSLYGFDLTPGAKHSRAQSAKALHALYARSLLTPEDDAFVLEPDLRALLLTSAAARTVIRITHSELSSMCCYLGHDGAAALVEPDPARSIGWLLRSLKHDELVQLLRDKEYLPIVDADTQRLLELTPRYWAQRENTSGETVKTMLELELIELDSEKRRTISIVRGALEYELIGSARLPYSEERLGEAIAVWLDASKEGC